MHNAAESSRALLGHKLCPACGDPMGQICIPCARRFPNRKAREQLSPEEIYKELDALIGSRNLTGPYLPFERHCQRVRELTGLEASNKEILTDPREIFRKYLEVRKSA